jgi:hypothetical protein
LVNDSLALREFMAGAHAYGGQLRPKTIGTRPPGPIGTSHDGTAEASIR